MKKGFTLIELLAVIVILAIIALIATPIILGIINDAREKANERSMDLYVSAIKNSIAAYQLKTLKSPESFDDLTIEYEGKVECSIQELYEDESFYLEGCKVNDSKKEYSYGEQKIIEPAVQPCTTIKQNDAKYSVGDEVICDIGEIPDKFYIIEDAELTSPTIKMLTEKNIHTTEYRQRDDAGEAVLFSNSNYWSDETTYPIDVYDERNDVIKPIVDEYVIYLNTKLTNATGSLLTYNKTKSLGCNDSISSCTNALSWIYSTSYWLGTAYNPGCLWVVLHDGNFTNDSFEFGSYSLGVRPVITISTSDVG